MKNKKNLLPRACLLIGLVVLAFSSCGYELVREKGIYGGDISSLNVPIFKNSTYEPHASAYVTDAFSKELASTGLFTINKEGSDGYVEGTIKRVAIAFASIGITGAVNQKTVTLEVDLSLFRKDGTFIKKWTFADTEVYRTDDVNAEDYNKREAMSRVSARIARKFSSVILIEY